MADVILETTVPDAHITRVHDDFTLALNKQIQLEIESDTEIGSIDFTIMPIEGETPAALGRRVLRILGRELCRAVEDMTAREKYRKEIKKVSRDVVNVPDDVLQ